MYGYTHYTQSRHERKDTIFGFCKEENTQTNGIASWHARNNFDEVRLKRAHLRQNRMGFAYFYHGIYYEIIRRYFVEQDSGGCYMGVFKSDANSVFHRLFDWILCSFFTSKLNHIASFSCKIWIYQVFHAPHFACICSISASKWHLSRHFELKMHLYNK